MARQRHLPRAPIREAVIDLRVPHKSGLARLSEIAKGCKGDYPNQVEIRARTLGIELKGPDDWKASSVDQGSRGYRLASADGKNVAQLRVDGFAFSRLAEYETWERMSAEARRLWSLYCERSELDPITRFAVRYVNVMEFPLPVGDLKEYLVSPPEVPERLPQGISSYLMRVVLHDADSGAQAIVTQAMEALSSDKVPVILDIDVFAERQISAFAQDDLWRELEKLRVLKNRIFFESITEKTASLFE